MGFYRMKVKFYYDYPINLDIDCNKEVNVFIDKFTLEDIPPNSLRIIILQEPWRSPMMPLVQKYKGYYTHVLTYQEEILQTNPKARLFHFPNTWVKDYEPKKEFSVSTVVGGKNIQGLEGHELRHELWRNRNKIVIPKKFYLSGNAKHSHSFVPWSEADYTNQLVLGASKEPLFDSMFHICIENTSIVNFFTEKIIDCFQTRTVPIYYGCSNIGDYFNINGIFDVRSIKEMIDVCNRLTPELYNEMLPYLDDNFDRSNKWCDQIGQLENMIKQILKEENA
jgi:hypothetical protein